ncbi:MAG: DUF87 domain-containing protein [Flexilinea sp.]
MEQKTIGYIVGGSLKEGFLVRLTVPADEVQEGGFVVIQSGSYRFYGLITNLRLGTTDSRFAENTNELHLSKELAMLLYDQTLYTELEVLPALMQRVGPEPGSPEFIQYKGSVDSFPIPVKTLPVHHAPVRTANAFDVGEIFGNPDEKSKFIIGLTREQNHPVAIDMDKFVQRSSGIFGATGTGKSYLTRLILAGLIHSRQASVLVFDMHNEYAYGDVSPDTNIRVPGLKDKLGSRVKVCALGRGTEINRLHPDFDLVIEQRDVLPEDVEMLSRELNLRETTANTLAALIRSFGEDHWFRNFMELRPGEGEGSVSEWAEQVKIHPMAAEGLQSKLTRVYNKPYIVEKAPVNCVQQIIDTLQSGCSVVLSFGKYESDLDYLLITNILTRKIREAWEKRTNDYHGGSGTKPTPLVIAVEEAHKLLNREMAAQTSFAVIAREMRKYFVTLLVIDQRPSQIYDEVMSQLGTRISGWLGDDADISAVLSGLAGREALRGMLSRLQPKEEVLLLGYGIPMPLPVRSRRYDEQFWKELLDDDTSKKFNKNQPDWMFDDRN